MLGGTGTMGKYLSAQLSSSGGNLIFVTSRKMHADEAGVHYIEGNAKDYEFLKRIRDNYEKWDAIIDFLIYSKKEFEERYDCLLSMTNQYIFLSSARVYAESDVPITEQSGRLLDVSKDVEVGVFASSITV